MKARDVMVAPVITVRPDSSVHDVAKIFVDMHVSGVPVLDGHGKLVGIVTEGDLLHRTESGTERRRHWWLLPLLGDDTLALDYVKSHSRKVADVMTKRVITASPDTPLHEIATMLEANSIKRIPIVHNGELVGIVSRANLIQAVANPKATLDIPLSDTTIREKIVSHLSQYPWGRSPLFNVTVRDGVAELWGFTQTDAEHKAMCVAAESIPGVRAVHDNLVTRKMERWS